MDDASFYLANQYLKLLNPSDFGAAGAGLNVRSALGVFIDSLENGIYTSGNGAALVARSQDALFVSFRGTAGAADIFLNDLTVGGFTAHWENFAALRTAITSLIDDPASGISKVYVTGHSLGASMVQAMMREHTGDARFEAVTFGNPGFQLGFDMADPRITNFANDGDPVTFNQLFARTDGDKNVFVDGLAATGLGLNEHKMNLYYEEAQFLRRYGIDLAQTNGTGGISDFDSIVLGAHLRTEVPGTYTIGNEAENLQGTAGADLMLGGIGDDTLDGLGGADRMIGGEDNDTYVVDSVADVVIEVGGGGIRDRVQAKASYLLSQTADIEFLETVNAVAITAINLIGNDLDNFIVGNAGANALSGRGGGDTLRGNGGNDVLNGGLGNDAMIGGNGNDTYYVGSAGDVVTETNAVLASGGNDLVISTVTRTLGANIERLTLGGAAAINGTGNTLANTLTGNLAGNTLNGAAGNDTLNGGLGLDRLTGGLGNDSFVFNTALNSLTNRDTITDFHNLAGDNDTIRLENAIFTTLGATNNVALNAAFFKANATGVATDANDHIIYNTVTGLLSYDTNGNAAGGITQIAIITGHPVLTATDFFVI